MNSIRPDSISAEALQSYKENQPDLFDGYLWYVEVGGRVCGEHMLASVPGRVFEVLAEAFGAERAR